MEVIYNTNLKFNEKVEVNLVFGVWVLGFVLV